MLVNLNQKRNSNKKTIHIILFLIVIIVIVIGGLLGFDYFNDASKSRSNRNKKDHPSVPPQGKQDQDQGEPVTPSRIQISPLTKSDFEVQASSSESDDDEDGSSHKANESTNNDASGGNNDIEISPDLSQIWNNIDLIDKMIKQEPARGKHQLLDPSKQVGGIRDRLLKVQVGENYYDQLEEILKDSEETLKLIK